MISSSRGVIIILTSAARRGIYSILESDYFVRLAIRLTHASMSACVGLLFFVKYLMNLTFLSAPIIITTDLSSTFPRPHAAGRIRLSSVRIVELYFAIFFCIIFLIKKLGAAEFLRLATPIPFCLASGKFFALSASEIGSIHGVVRHSNGPWLLLLQLKILKKFQL